jgi:hypothetical protein
MWVNLFGCAMAFFHASAVPVEVWRPQCTHMLGMLGSCSDSRTSAALLENIGQSQLTITENETHFLLTFGQNVLRLR